MSVINRSAEVLAALRAQRAPPMAVETVEGLFEREARIRRERYNGEREKEELAAARAETLANLQAVLVETDRALDVECAKRLDTLEGERATRSREGRAFKDVVDVQRLRESDDVAEIVSIVADAERAGDAVGEAARAAAMPRVKALAAVEQRKHLINGPAFRALCDLSRRQQSGRGTTDAANVIEHYAQRKRAARTMVLQVAEVAGLADALKNAAVRATVPAPSPATKSTITFGRFWDMHPELRQGR
jgi:hypothetical protein